MPRRAPRGDELRSAIVTVRLTASERARLDQNAAAAGMTPSAYAATMLTTGRVVIEQRQTMAPPLFLELSRIGNNLNQMAHGLNAGFAPDARKLTEDLDRLVKLLMADELTRRRIQDIARSQGEADGSQASRARTEFQGRVAVPVSRQGPG